MAVSVKYQMSSRTITRRCSRAGSGLKQKNLSVTILRKTVTLRWSRLVLATNYFQFGSRSLFIELSTSKILFRELSSEYFHLILPVLISTILLRELSSKYFH